MNELPKDGARRRMAKTTDNTINAPLPFTGGITPPGELGDAAAQTAQDPCDAHINYLVRKTNLLILSFNLARLRHGVTR